jgi:hypothetical protein
LKRPATLQPGNLASVFAISKASRLTSSAAGAPEQARTACLPVSKASRFASSAAGAPEQAGTACLPVSKASRLTSLAAGAPEQAETACLPVSKASRLTSLAAGAPEQAGTACLPVKASRFAFLFGQPAKRRYSRECKAGPLCLRKWLKVPRLGCVFAILASLLPVFADPAPGVSNGPATRVSAPGAFVTINHLGEPDQPAAVREGQLLSRRRATDPFGNTIRGPYKALPPVLEHPSATPGAASVAGPVASPVAGPVVDEPTIEKAVRELSIGAVNVGAHEILIGSRSVREGDLLVLESGSRQFVVWLQKVGVHGVLFCDIDGNKPLEKPFGSGPRESPEDSFWGMSDFSNFLNKNAAP